MVETKHVIFTHNLSFTSLPSSFTYGIHLLKQTAHLKLRKKFKIVQKRLIYLKSYHFSKNPSDYLCPTGAEFRFGIINHNLKHPAGYGPVRSFMPPVSLYYY
jgi:hypothetical protein